MSEAASAKASVYLKKLGVIVRTNSQVSAYEDQIVTTKDGTQVQAGILVWAAGVTGEPLKGLPSTILVKGNRIRVNRFNKVEGVENIFALGDIAYMVEPAYPEGHPQVAQPAIQQAKLLAKNLEKMELNLPLGEFSYFNKGSMATVGRNLAVVDLPFISFHGFFAWLTWMFVHLMAIVGVKNRMLIFINWFWNYVTYDQSLRLIIKPYRKNSQ